MQSIWVPAVARMFECSRFGCQRLQGCLNAVDLGASGCKDVLVVKLVVFMEMCNEVMIGTLDLDTMTVPEMRELKKKV